MVCNVITADKANRLFWVGRYAERVYISLHLLRRYYDQVIDGNITDLKEYYKFLGVNSVGQDEESEAFQLAQLYDGENICSIMASLDGANDNAIFLRRDITSESLSYIQMSKALLAECAKIKEKNITHLQPVTDYMLAFFGSIDERVFDELIRKYIKMGRFVENIDLHIRFNYPFFRIEEVYVSLKDCIKATGANIDKTIEERLELLISEESYRPELESYRAQVLECLNSLILV